MSNIEIENYFGAKDPNFEIYDELMREKALSWVKQSGTNYHELIGDVSECAETAFANNGEIAIPDNNTQPVFVDASGIIPKVVNEPVIVNTSRFNPNKGGIVIPDNNTQSIFVDASGEIPRVVKGPVEVKTAELNNMYTDLFGFPEEAPYDNSPVHRSGRRR